MAKVRSSLWALIPTLLWQTLTINIRVMSSSMCIRQIDLLYDSSLGIVLSWFLMNEIEFLLIGEMSGKMSGWLTNDMEKLFSSRKRN